ncbi:MAG: hypothetical protein LBS23_02805 [Holosporaceae bacterium]|jgi:D-alanine--D-alanine ligase|nr:hypothetical protein [Holosporaceae bacterium]
MGAGVFKLAIICGGPSLERGISLNSARSVMDHLSSEGIEIFPFYVDLFKNFYQLSKAQLYSNTPSDFDFKLKDAGRILTKEEFIERLRQTDLVFPIMHGDFGENGEIQDLLEIYDLPFMGPSSQTARRMFHKNIANDVLRANGYDFVSVLELHKGDSDILKKIQDFKEKHRLTRLIVKPAAGGSSIGVSSASIEEKAKEYADNLFNLGMKTVLVEPFHEGTEFTIIILQSLKDGSPVALCPSEINISYENNSFFDFRSKYLPTAAVKWPCPPQSFDKNIVQSIRKQSENLFALFKMRDFARVDGWVLENGRIIFTDFNPISGMEQNSFIFEQSTRLGFTHDELLLYIVKNACNRHQITPPKMVESTTVRRLPVGVLFGGITSERQVSLMSGTNIWQKLRHSKKYLPIPFFYDSTGNIWKISYTHALNHTVEEVEENCFKVSHKNIQLLQTICSDARKRLGLNQYDISNNFSKKFTFDEFIKFIKQEGIFIFNALHGGDGENGVIQNKFDEHCVSYSGSGERASSICADKYRTGQVILQLKDPIASSLPKKTFKTDMLFKKNTEELKLFYEEMSTEWRISSIIIKPQNDGCSSGIVRLGSSEDLSIYLKFIQEKARYIPPYVFYEQKSMVEMPSEKPEHLVFEPFIVVDKIQIIDNALEYTPNTGWLELTVGVLENCGLYSSMNPSITIAKNAILALEEKFQGGTGVNITPPPENIVAAEDRRLIKQSVETVSKALEIENYGRIDCFWNIKTKKLIIIEANTSPAMTGSTVIFHQALAEEKSLTPLEFIELIIQNSIANKNSKA